jgi:crossover junction endodeoxyribonuclease RuvC
MRVMGIDPGTVTTGYGMVEGLAVGQLSYTASGIISTPSRHTLPKRLRKIYDELTTLFECHRPTVVVVEDTFLARNVQTALKLGQARGVVLLVAEMCGIPTVEYTATQVKNSVAGYGAAPKEQVRQMVLRLLDHPGLDEQLSSHHAADALACAICHLHSVKVKAAMIDELI